MWLWKALALVGGLHFFDLHVNKWETWRIREKKWALGYKELFRVYERDGLCMIHRSSLLQRDTVSSPIDS